jgi:hypothetical protein
MALARTTQLERRLAAIEAKVDRLAAVLLGTSADSPSPLGAPTPDTPAVATASQLDKLRNEAQERHAELLRRLQRTQEILQVLYDREPEMRERLSLMRREPAYQEAFDADEPLVSIVIPTYDRGELLVNRAIPSVLAQTYENLEIIVVGDGAPEETGRWLEELRDPRITYRNLSYRGPYPDDLRDLWHVAGIPPRNLGMSLARGLWIAPLDDDDAFHPHHIERLLALARRERHEVSYGVLRCLMNDGTEFPLGRYPPEIGHFGWQSAIFHCGLRFFEMELADALFFCPADWSLCRRMLRAGVRFGMLDEVVTDHYESRFAPKFD